MAEEQIITKIKAFINEIKLANIRVSKVFLFGSYANGIPTEVSDIDVAVISPDFGNSYFQEARLLLKIANKIDIMIFPDPYSLESYEKAKPGDFLWQEIINKGQLIEV